MNIRIKRNTAIIYSEQITALKLEFIYNYNLFYNIY